MTRRDSIRIANIPIRSNRTLLTINFRNVWLLLNPNYRQLTWNFFYFNKIWKKWRIMKRKWQTLTSSLYALIQGVNQFKEKVSKFPKRFLSLEDYVYYIFYHSKSVLIFFLSGKKYLNQCKWIKILTKILENECQILFDSHHQGGAKEEVVEPSHVGHVSYY